VPATPDAPGAVTPASERARQVALEIVGEGRDVEPQRSMQQSRHAPNAPRAIAAAGAVSFGVRGARTGDVPAVTDSPTRRCSSPSVQRSLNWNSMPGLAAWQSTGSSTDAHPPWTRERRLGLGRLSAPRRPEPTRPRQLLPVCWGGPPCSSRDRNKRCRGGGDGRHPSRVHIGRSHMNPNVVRPGRGSPRHARSSGWRVSVSPHSEDWAMSRTASPLPVTLGGMCQVSQPSAVTAGGRVGRTR
jgi:hypothetical protein